MKNLGFVITWWVNPEPDFGSSCRAVFTLGSAAHDCSDVRLWGGWGGALALHLLGCLLRFRLSDSPRCSDQPMFYPPWDDSLTHCIKLEEHCWLGANRPRSWKIGSWAVPTPISNSLISHIRISPMLSFEETLPWPKPKTNPKTLEKQVLPHKYLKGIFLCLHWWFLSV